MIKLERLSDRPILTPDPSRPWERAAVFNPAAIYDNGLFHLLYRATDIGCHARYGRYLNSIGYAVSTDGIHFMKLDQPVMGPGAVPQELRGPEDGRLVKIGDTYHLTYTGFGGRFEGDWRICRATSKNLITWERHGVVLDEPNKNAALFPEQIGGRWVLLHRRYPDIWVCFSDDLQTWYGHTRILSPIPGTWQDARVGIAGPPIKTPQGWFLIYHAAYSRDNSYRLGAALLDLEDPTKVLARQAEPILEPELEWERRGWVPNVVFSNGHAIKGDDLYVYYGAADTVIGVAGMRLSDIRF
ncbi:MAG: glycosidase [Bacillota bacterium]|nr:MAG: glycosidase [Bacillota bacterium]